MAALAADAAAAAAQATGDFRVGRRPDLRLMATATRPQAVQAATLEDTGAIGAAVVVSPDRLVRTGVRRTLDRSGFTIAAEASSLAPVLSTARKPGVAIAVVDIEGDVV